MASLKRIVREYRGDIFDGIAWVVIYKDGRSWEAELFYAEDGCFDDGYVFNDSDIAEMKTIASTDNKAICINGYYMPFGEDFTLSEIEYKILYFYHYRLNQLKGDFLNCMVIQNSKP